MIKKKRVNIWKNEVKLTTKISIDRPREIQIKHLNIHCDTSSDIISVYEINEDVLYISCVKKYKNPACRIPITIQTVNVLIS